MKETKVDAIDAAPIQIHHEVVPGMRSEASEQLIGAREAYGPGGKHSYPLICRVRWKTDCNRFQGLVL